MLLGDDIAVEIKLAKSNIQCYQQVLSDQLNEFTEGIPNKLNTYTKTLVVEKSPNFSITLTNFNVLTFF